MVWPLSTYCSVPALSRREVLRSVTVAGVTISTPPSRPRACPLLRATFSPDFGGPMSLPECPLPLDRRRPLVVYRSPLRCQPTTPITVALLLAAVLLFDGVCHLHAALPIAPLTSRFVAGSCCMVCGVQECCMFKHKHQQALQCFYVGIYVFFHVCPCICSVTCAVVRQTYPMLCYVVLHRVGTSLRQPTLVPVFSFLTRVGCTTRYARQFSQNCTYSR